MKTIMLVMILFLVSGAPLSAQVITDVFPVADNADISETQPYVTRYWYEGTMGYYNNLFSVQNTYPLWLTYIENSPDGRQRIVARNLEFDSERQLTMHTPFILSDTTASCQLAHPLIENFLGRAVGLWIQKEGGNSYIMCSLFGDSSWSPPAIVAPLSSFEASIDFFTFDAYVLEASSIQENYLVWSSGNAVCKTSIDSNFIWTAVDTLYQSLHPLGRVNLRANDRKEMWLLFDEAAESDSTVIKTMILPHDSSGWLGPFELRKTPGTNPQPSLDYSTVYSGDYEMVLSWAESNSLRHVLLTLSGDSLRTEPLDTPGSESGEDFAFVSNTLNIGGCCIEPFPYYLYTCRTDSLNKVYLLSSWSGILLTSGNPVSHLALSGLDRMNFVCVWSENNQGQDDIMMASGYIAAGNVNHSRPLLARTMELYQNFPNPFNPQTTISYFLPRAKNIEMVLYDVSGRRVRTLVNGYQPAGLHAILLDGRRLSSGMYYYVLKSGLQVVSRRCVLVK